MSKKIVQTAGREQLGEFAPQFAHLNDIILADRKAFARMSDEEQEKSKADN